MFKNIVEELIQIKNCDIDISEEAKNFKTFGTFLVDKIKRTATSVDLSENQVPYKVFDGFELCCTEDQYDFKVSYSEDYKVAPLEKIALSNTVDFERMINPYSLDILARIAEGVLAPFKREEEKNILKLIKNIIEKDGNVIDLKMGQLKKTCGGIEQLDNINAMLFNKYILSPTTYLCSPSLRATLTEALMVNGYAIKEIDGRNSIVLNVHAEKYINKYANEQIINIVTYPYLEDGTMLVLTEKLPYFLPIEDVFKIETQYDYRLTTRLNKEEPNSYDVGISTREALVCYMPKAQVLIKNIKPGLADCSA